jgi:hypothetical protein
MKWVDKTEVDSAIIAFMTLIVTLVEHFGVPYFLKVEISFVESLILFLIQFLVFESVRERYGILKRIKDLVEKEKELFRDRSEFPLTEYLEKAKESIWVSAVSFGSLLNVDSDLIKRKYDDGCHIRVLLLRTDKTQETAKMCRGEVEEATLTRQIATSIEFLKKLNDTKSKKGGAIEAKFLPSFPGFGVSIIDGDTSEGEIKIELIPCGSAPYKRPNCFVTRKDPKRYEQLIEHFNNLWQVSEPI